MANPVAVTDYDPAGGMRVRRISRQSSYTGMPVEMERPQTLELPLTPRTPMRSSLKNMAAYGSHPGGATTRGSSGGTPTNPTPPDSLSEEVFVGGTSSSRSDSGFVSTTNRVRFSPSPFEKSGNIVMTTDWSPTHDPSLSAPSQGPLQRSRMSGRGMLHHHYVTESDLQRDFNLFSS